MKDSRINKMAKVLVNYSMGIKKGDLFGINGYTISEPLMLEVYKEALLAGANPILMPLIDEGMELLVKYGNDNQIAFPNPFEEMFVEKGDAWLTVWGQKNTKNMSNVDPNKLQLRAKGGAHITKRYMERMSTGELRWCGTQFPTYSAAMDADMSLMEYEEFVFDACLLNYDDPVAEWIKVHQLQEKYVDYLNNKSEFEVKSKDTHIVFSTKGRKWVNCDGKVNFPDGEIYTSPVESSINGKVRFSFPAIYMGKEVEDVELTFENGKVVKATAKKGEEFLNSILDTDEGARFVGEFAIGTNNNIKKFTKNILFDEKLGGTIHIAVGGGFSKIGGKNVSAIHWDLICDMKDGGEIYADGELFYKEGRFLI
ncbi:MAG: aminopeptidase [Bacillota bacterium]